MRVAFVNQPLDLVLPPHQNSIGIWTYQVARRLAGQYEITVYAKYMRSMPPPGGKTVTFDGDVRYRFIQGLPGRVWAKLSRLLGRLFTSKKPFYASWLYFLDYSLRVALDVRRNRYDVVHIHNFTGFVPVVRALNRRTKIVLHMNCEWLSQLDRAQMEKRIRQVDLVLGSSNHVTRLVRERFPKYADRCQTVFNGVDVDAFSARNGHGLSSGSESARTHLLFVGRVSPEKGVHDLIDAFGAIATQYPDACLELVGAMGALPMDYIVGVSDDPAIAGLARFYDDDYMDLLRARIPASLRDRVTFTGPLPHEDVVERFKTTDVLVNPSYSESFGMSLVEAMASEVPVVATRVGGMKEIVDDGTTGYFVDRGDVAGLASAIGILLTDRSRREAMGRAGRQRVIALFGWDKVAISLGQRYDALARRASPAGDPRTGSPGPVPSH